MTIAPWIGYLGASAVIGAVSRIWVTFKRDRRARLAFTAPMFPAEVLAHALIPESGDDSNVLAEMRQVFAHLNRQSYAEEFWRLDEQLSAYYAKLPKDSRPTFRRALMRMLHAGDRWCALISAKTCARIGFPEAAPAIESILQAADTPGVHSEADSRYGAELKSALGILQRSHAGL